MYRYQNPYQDQRLFLLAAPFFGGLVGGAIGSAVFRPRPFGGYPYYPPYGAYPPYFGGGPFY